MELPGSEPERPIYSIVDALVADFNEKACTYLDTIENNMVSGIIAFDGDLPECQAFAHQKKGQIAYTIKKDKNRKNANQTFADLLSFTKEKTFKSAVSY